MDTFDLSVKRFDEFAKEYAERFMDIDSYRSCIDGFCDLIIFYMCQNKKKKFVSDEKKKFKILKKNCEKKNRKNVKNVTFFIDGKLEKILSWAGTWS